jgi:hypothetical protein
MIPGLIETRPDNHTIVLVPAVRPTPLSVVEVIRSEAHAGYANTSDPRPIPAEVSRRDQGWISIGWGCYWKRNRANAA